MLNLFTNILALAAGSLFVLLFIFILWQALGKKYSIFWRFSACTILAVRLLLPFSFGEASLLWQLSAAVPVMDKQQVQMSDISLSGAENETGAAKDNISFQKQKEETAIYFYQGVFKETDSQKILHFLQIGASIWIVGMCLYFIHLFLSWLAFKRQIQRWSLKAEPAAMQIFSELCEEMNIKRKISLVQCEKVHSPMLTGLFRPCVIIPQNTYEHSEYRLFLQHELCHYIHGDLFFKYLLAVIRGMYWFVPWIHYLANVINRDIEILCDKEVIRRNGENCRQSYSMVLFSHMTKQQTDVVPFTTFFYGGKKQLKERFRQLMKPQIYKKGLSLVLCCILLIGIMSGTALSLADNIKESTNNRTKENNIAMVLDKKSVDNNAAQEKKQGKELIPVSKTEKEEGAAGNYYNGEYDGDYDILTFRLDVSDAPDAIQTWTTKCSSAAKIYITEYEERYWIYTKAVGVGKDYSFTTESQGAKKNKIIIKPYKDADGSGYALICAPKMHNLTVKCKKYTAKVKNG